MKRSFCFWVGVLCLLSSLLLPQAALKAWALPSLPEAQTDSFYAQDNAGVLSPETKDYLNTLGRELQSKTKAQLTVVTIKSLEGSSIEEYANALFRQYKLGDKKLNNGCLILIAVDDHKLRIEVGYGLEGALPDGYTGRVRDLYITPSFKKNDFDTGVKKGCNALAEKIA